MEGIWGSIEEVEVALRFFAVPGTVIMLLLPRRIILSRCLGVGSSTIGFFLTKEAHVLSSYTKTTAVEVTGYTPP